MIGPVPASWHTALAPALAESRGADRSAAEVGETAHRSTVFIRCEM